MANSRQSLKIQFTADFQQRIDLIQQGRISKDDIIQGSMSCESAYLNATAYNMLLFGKAESEPPNSNFIDYADLNSCRGKSLG